MKDTDELSANFIQNLYVKIGKNVKYYRESKGLTQLQLSQAIGHKSVTIVSRAEICYKGQHFNIEHLAKIAYVLEVDLCVFFQDL
jgi:transcriptional regulator with XRE-family HTH domain